MTVKEQANHNASDTSFQREGTSNLRRGRKDDRLTRALQGVVANVKVEKHNARYSKKANVHRKHHYGLDSKSRDLNTQRYVRSYPKDQILPFSRQLGHKLFPNCLNDDTIRPQFLHFAQMNFRCQEKQWREPRDKLGPFTCRFVIYSLVPLKACMSLSVEVYEPPMC